MLVAKLKSPLSFVLQISPTKTEIREVDAFYVNVVRYKLGELDSKFQVIFSKQEDVPVNPASDVIGEGPTKVTFPTRKIFTETLTENELSLWGSDDKSLLEIFAVKYGVEIESFVQIN